MKVFSKTVGSMEKENTILITEVTKYMKANLKMVECTVKALFHIINGDKIQGTWNQGKKDGKFVFSSLNRPNARVVIFKDDMPFETDPDEDDLNSPERT